MNRQKIQIIIRVYFDEYIDCDTPLELLKKSTKRLTRELEQSKNRWGRQRLSYPIG